MHPKRLFWLLIALSAPLLVLSPTIANANTGMTCPAYSKARGEWCIGENYKTKAACEAALIKCDMVALAYAWCKKIDQPSCKIVDDCKPGADGKACSCFVHPIKQKKIITGGCSRNGITKLWQFGIFDGFECKCDCAKGAFVPPVIDPDDIGCVDAECLGCLSDDPDSECFPIPFEEPADEVPLEELESNLL